VHFHQHIGEQKVACNVNVGGVLLTRCTLVEEENIFYLYILIVAHAFANVSVAYYIVYYIRT